MWTCDVIKAMQILEERVGYPFCIRSVRYWYSAPSVLVIETTDEDAYFYDTVTGMLIEG